MLTFFTDTDTDFGPREVEKYGCKLISMPYSYDGKTIFPYVDFKEFDSHEFYDMLRSGVLPTTSAIGEQDYINYFEPEFAAGNDILYAHFSREMTVTFDVMDKALVRLKEKYPERKFYEVDAKGITTMAYIVVRAIAELYKAGKTGEEIVEWSKTEVDHYAMYFFADDLKFFRRSGRVSGLAATMGGLIGLRPIITMSKQGRMESIGTEKGRTKAMERLLKYVDEMGDDVKNHLIVIGHTDAPELAQQFAEMMKAKYGADLNIDTVAVNPTAGSHCGPNGVGVCFHSKDRFSK